MLADLEHEQKRGICLSKSLSKLQKETVKNEKVSANLFKKGKENIDIMNDLQE